MEFTRSLKVINNILEKTVKLIEVELGNIMAAR